MSNTDRAPILLIADDDADDRLMLSRSLQDAGFEGDIEFCLNGEQLLHRLRREGAKLPSLVLLDLKMPFVGGLEALEMIRADARLSALPVVAVTTSDMPSDVLQAYRLGVNAYVRKPGSMAQLRSMMEVLKRFWFDVAILPGAVLP